MAKEDAVLNRYNIAVAKAQDLQEQMRLKNEAWGELKKSFDHTEQLMRELCESILAKDRNESRLGREYAWSKVGIDELIRKAERSLESTENANSDMMRRLIRDNNERNNEIKNLNEELRSEKIARGEAAEPDAGDGESGAVTPGGRGDPDGAGGERHAGVKAVSKEDDDFIPDDEDDVATLQVTERSIPVSATRRSRQDRSRTGKTHEIDLGEWEEKLKEYHWAVLVTVGSTGHSEYKDIEAAILKERPGASRNKIRDAVNQLATFGVTEMEEFPGPKSKVRLYTLTPLGVRLYTDKAGTDPKTSELTALRKEHDNVAHGYGIRSVADVIREQGEFREVVCMNGRKSVKTDDGRSYIPDITCTQTNGRKLYIEYEVGTTPNSSFYSKCNKMVGTGAGTLYFLGPNRDVVDKRLKGQIEGWIDNRRADEDREILKGVTVCLTGAKRIMDGGRVAEDATWQYIYRPEKNGKVPTVN